MDAGVWLKQLSGDDSYDTFIPNLLPLELPVPIDNKILTLLSTADRFLGRLDGVCELLPDVDFFIFMYIRKEAASSSQIEGTVATLSDFFKAESEIDDPARPADVQEIINYVSAMNYGIERLKELPLSLRLIKEIHFELMKDVRGQNKLPGEFRRSQNWIGAAQIENAVYIPPPPERLMTLLDDFEKFLHNDVPIPALIKIALIHSQFELIHPFLDGNGRVGRLLTTFYLCEKGILRKPFLYLSEYFKKNRSLYYERLEAISKRSDLLGWIVFFLEAIKEVSEEAVELSRKIIYLRERDRAKIAALGRSAKNAGLILERLYRYPFINSEIVRKTTNLSLPNALQLIHRLEVLGILKKDSQKVRNMSFCYKDYIDLF